MSTNPMQCNLDDLVKCQDERDEARAEVELLKANWEEQNKAVADAWVKLAEAQIRQAAFDELLAAAEAVMNARMFEENWNPLRAAILKAKEAIK